MSDELRAIGTYVLGAVLALLAWAGKRQIRRLDTIEERLTELQADYVGEDIFMRTVADMRAEIAQGNRETHKRLDELMLLLAKRAERVD